MRLITYRTHAAAAARLGAIVDDLVIDLQALGEHAGQAIPGDMLAFIDLGPHAVASTSTLLASYRGKWPLGVALPLVNAGYEAIAVTGYKAQGANGAASPDSTDTVSAEVMARAQTYIGALIRAIDEQ